MKNRSKLFGKHSWRFCLLAFAVVIGLATACESPSGSTTTTPRVISIAAITGVTVPATGANPVTAIAETEEFTGTVTWTPAVSGVFAAGTVYTARITLTAKDGFTLEGVEANFFQVAGAAASNAAGTGIVTAAFPRTGNIEPGELECMHVYSDWSVAAPACTAAGERSRTCYRCSDTIAETLPAIGHSWSDMNWIVTKAPTETETGTELRTCRRSGCDETQERSIPATGKTGHDHIWSEWITVSETSMATSGEERRICTYENCTVYEARIVPRIPFAVISIAALQGVTAPVRGAVPASAITETEQYTGTVRWNGSPSSFAAESVYTATITLTPKFGFTLQGVGANFFTVAGASSPAANEAGSGVITATFPATAAVVISMAVIPLAAPDPGRTPVTAIVTQEYSGTVTWNGNPAVFALTTPYTANITLTANPGYTLQGVAANFFTVAGASPVSNAANSGVVTAVFPATGTTITINGISAITAPVLGARPMTAITETTQFTGTVAWNPPVDNGTFEAGVSYNAIITLRAKPGYSLHGVGANFFTVAGILATNAANSGVITTVKFPVTGSGGYMALYWANQQGESGIASVTERPDPNTFTLDRSEGEFLTIGAIGPGYTVYQWSVNGVSLGSGAEYTFSSVGKPNGAYTISLIVSKDGKYYNINFTVTVTD